MARMIVVPLLNLSILVIDLDFDNYIVSLERPPMLTAKSDYEAAKVDLIISGFCILRTYGALDVNAF
jgi:hypothetical protein